MCRDLGTGGIWALDCWIVGLRYPKAMIVTGEIEKETQVEVSARKV